MRSLNLDTKTPAGRLAWICLALLGVLAVVSVALRSAAWREGHGEAGTEKAPIEEPGPLLGEHDARSGAEIRSAVPATASGTGSPGPSSTLVVLEVADSSPVAGKEWRLSETRTQTHVLLRSDDLGAVQVAPGTYSMEARDGSFLPTLELVDARASSTQVVWVRALGAIEVEVFSTLGAPIEGAQVRWTPRDFLSRGNALDSPEGSAVATTDAEGRATIVDVPTAAGDLDLSADGYLTERRYLAGKAEDRLRVILRPAFGEPVPWSVRDRLSGEPIAGALVRTECGDRALSDADGLVRLQGWAAGRNPLIRFEADGYLPRDQRGKDSHEVLLDPASRLTLTVVGEGESGAIQLVARTPGQDSDRAWKVEGAIGEALRLQVPRTALEVDVVEGNGRTSTFGLDVYLEAHAFELRLGQGWVHPPLVLECSGAEPAGVQAVATYDDGVVQDLSPDEGGRLYIGGLGRLRSVQLAAPGHLAWSLYPVRGVRGDALAGHLAVAFEPALEVSVEVADPMARPIPGMRVELWPLRSGSDSYPELNGGWPTGHRNWIRFHPPVPGGTTDALGRFKGLFAEGEYELRVFTANVHGEPGHVRSQYLPVDRRLYVSADGAVERVVVARPRLIGIEVYDALSQLPVPSVQVSVPGMPGEVRPGCFWQGWVAEDTAELHVFSPGFGRAVLGLGGLGAEIARVVVVPDNPITLRVVGAEGGGQRVVVSFMERSPEGHDLLMSYEVELDSDGEAALSAPYEDVPLSVSVQLVGDRENVVEPAHRALEPDQDVVFRLVR